MRIAPPVPCPYRASANYALLRVVMIIKKTFIIRIQLRAKFADYLFKKEISYNIPKDGDFIAEAKRKFCKQNQRFCYLGILQDITPCDYIAGIMVEPLAKAIFCFCVRAYVIMYVHVKNIFLFFKILYE